MHKRDTGPRQSVAAGAGREAIEQYIGVVLFVTHTTWKKPSGVSPKQHPGGNGSGSRIRRQVCDPFSTHKILLMTGNSEKLLPVLRDKFADTVHELLAF